MPFWALLKDGKKNRGRVHSYGICSTLANEKLNNIEINILNNRRYENNN